MNENYKSYIFLMISFVSYTTIYLLIVSLIIFKKKWRNGIKIKIFDN